MLMREHRRLPATYQRGLSLVELMVGVVVGLFVVASAATVISTQLADTRRLVVETQIQQDLRASVDIMTREIRRAGYWAGSTAVNGGTVWSAGSTVGSNLNAPITVTASEVGIAWDSASAKGFRLASAGSGAAQVGVLQLKDGSGAWQDLTDKTTVNIMQFTPQLVTTASLPLACPADCAGGGQACWPTVEVREVRLTLVGKSISDANVVRSLVSAVRLRNDLIKNNNGGGPLCPV